jgi:hypothetical protein
LLPLVYLPLRTQGFYYPTLMSFLVSQEPGLAVRRRSASPSLGCSSLMVRLPVSRLIIFFMMTCLVTAIFNRVTTLADL